MPNKLLSRLLIVIGVFLLVIVVGYLFRDPSLFDVGLVGTTIGLAGLMLTIAINIRKDGP